MNFMTGNYVISSWWRKIVSVNLIFGTFSPKKTISFGFGKYFTYLESPPRFRPKFRPKSDGHINMNPWSKIPWSYEYEQTVQWTMATFDVKCPIIDPLGISTRYHHLNTSKEVFPFIENSTVLMTQFKMTNLVKESGFDRIASLNNPNLREFIGQIGIRRFPRTFPDLVKFYMI